MDLVQTLYFMFSEVESEIVGIVLYYYRYSTWKGKTLHLEDLVVKEKCAAQELDICIQKL
jgi:hypothetical protein